MKAELRREIGRLRRAPRLGRVWPSGRRAALSISFDDARPSQVHAGTPALDRLGVAATFFVLPGPVAAQPARWREAVAAGHEIGNHTVHHPCSGNFEFSRAHALEDLTLDDLRRELDEADRQIHELLGITPKVFAYPCGQTFVGRGRDTLSLVPLITERFAAGRTFNDVTANSPSRCDLAQVAAINSDEMTFAQLRPRLESTLRDGAWLVLGGHEFGECGDPETTAATTLEAVVGWCRDHDVWIETVGAVARHLSALTRRDASDQAASLAQP